MQSQDPSLLIFFLATLGMFLLVVAIIGFTMYYYRRQADMRREHQVALLKASVETQEAERLRIARDLHDEMGPLLSAAKMSLERASRAKTPEQQAELTQHSRELINSAVENARSISHDLYPITLKHLGLAGALSELVNKLQPSFEGTMAIECQVPITPREEVSVTLYRILKELINNTLKHAQATAIIIQLDYQSNRLHLIYRDNGVTTATGSRGLGMTSMYQRVELLGGEMRIEGMQGAGMTAEVYLPANV